MPDELEMAAPVTRGEMNDAMREWSEVILARISELASEMRALVKASEGEILRQVKGMLEPFNGTPERSHELERHELARRVDELDEAQFPARVGRLEAKVFAPKRRATAARRKRS